MKLAVRDAGPSDIAALHAIYSHHVLTGLGTFDETPPPLAEFEAKWRASLEHGLSWLVAVDADVPVGYAYASLFRPRRGYRYTVEDSVYIREDQRKRGVGSALLAPLIKRCEALGVRQVVAVIGDSGNVGSIRLHAKHGFVQAGTVVGAGFKFRRWVDIVIMQRALNGGASGAPADGAGWWRD
ncbi:MAG: N-acetyltransferase [Alphaproteobacteria bacterium]|nr:N-acetyltransferase [Alphaproteobacteria bacterium]